MSPSTLGERLLGQNPPTAGPPTLDGRFGGDHVLAPLLTNEVPAVTDQLKVAAAIARPTGAGLSVVNPISVPEQTPRTYARSVGDVDDEALLEWAIDHAADATPQVSGGLLYTRDVIAGVLSAVRTQAVDTLVLPNTVDGTRVRNGLTKRLAAHADCDVVMVNGQAGFDGVASLLLPVAGGPHSGLAADIARAIAADSNAWIDILHVIDDDATPGERERATELVETVYRRIGRPETTTTWLLERDHVAGAITEQSKYYGLTILGAPTKGRLRRFVGASTNQSVRARARSVVLSARNNSGE